MRAWVVAVVLAPALAWANARAPMTTGVYLRPGDPQTIYARTTFGLLVSHDAGCSFRWICEKALEYGGGWDPKLAIAADGTVFATTYQGLRVSRDGGCTWETAMAGAGDAAHLGEAWVDGIEIAPNGHIWIVTAESAKPNNIYESADNGRTFEPRGMFSRTVWYKSLKVARSTPSRIYATGYQVAAHATAHLYRSDDAGAAWTELPLSIRYGATPVAYVVGVDPTNADVVYLTSGVANPPSGDRLYRSADGGKTFAEVLATTDPIHDVVFASHGVIVAAGRDAFEARDGLAFTKLAATPQLACLAQRADATLIGCGANWAPDQMALATSSTGASWQKLLQLGELAGPLRCAPGTTVHDACAAQWPSLQQQLGASPPSSCPASSDTVVTSPPPPPHANTHAHGGCCDAGRSPPSMLALLVVAVAVVIGRRRR